MGPESTVDESPSTGTPPNGASASASGGPSPVVFTRLSLAAPASRARRYKRETAHGPVVSCFKHQCSTGTAGGKAGTTSALFRRGTGFCAEPREAGRGALSCAVGGPPA